MVEADLFTRSWAEDEDPPTGGSSASITVTADDKTTSVPDFPTDASGLEVIYEAVEALVPAEVWDSLNSQRQEFIDAFEAE